MYTFKHRDEPLDVDLSQQLVIHRGLWKALNLA